MQPILKVDDLSVTFETDDGPVRAVEGVSLTLNPGETVGLVGESGSGKTLTGLAIMQLVGSSNSALSGEITFEGQSLTGMSSKGLRRIRGNDIAMIFQNAMVALNPMMTVGRQMAQVLQAHTEMNAAQIRSRSLELLQLAGIPRPATNIDRYPHEFSGGMRQRALIAISISCNPKVLIADEPTTALDVSIQSQIVTLLRQLRDELGMSLILITHDLGLLAGIADRVYVMYAGKVVESGTSEEIFYSPEHPYTEGLLKSAPNIGWDQDTTLTPIPGIPAGGVIRPRGCAFHPRCAHATELCMSESPLLQPQMDSHQTACWMIHPDPKEGPAEERMEGPS